jgi:hypothetical protein
MFSAFVSKSLQAGVVGTYYRDKAYPIDLNGAQDYGRMGIAGGGNIGPFPVMTNVLKVTAPMIDQFILRAATAENPFGPWVGAPQGPGYLAFPQISGGLVKQQP